MKKSKWILVLALVMSVGIIITAFSDKMNTGKTTSPMQYTPKEGFVPNGKTAIEVAKAIWVPIYGKGVLNKSPFNVSLKDSTVWVVTGTLPEGMKGGVPYIEIKKSDCSILKVEHGK